MASRVHVNHPSPIVENTSRDHARQNASVTIRFPQA